jgi:hypothetical protein
LGPNTARSCSSGSRRLAAWRRSSERRCAAPGRAHLGGGRGRKQAGGVAPRPVQPCSCRPGAIDGSIAAAAALPPRARRARRALGWTQPAATQVRWRRRRRPAAAAATRAAARHAFRPPAWPHPRLTRSGTGRSRTPSRRRRAPLPARCAAGARRARAAAAAAAPTAALRRARASGAGRRPGRERRQRRGAAWGGTAAAAAVAPRRRRQRRRRLGAGGRPAGWWAGCLRTSASGACGGCRQEGRTCQGTQLVTGPDAGEHPAAGPSAKPRRGALLPKAALLRRSPCAAGPATSQRAARRQVAGWLFVVRELTTYSITGRRGAGFHICVFLPGSEKGHALS